MDSIVLTGGGTAGHVMPNLALVGSLLDKGYAVHYLGTADGIEKRLVEVLPGVTYHRIHSGKWRRYFSLKNLTDPFRVLQGYFEARRALKQLRPRAVFSKGGFVSVPVMMAARSLKIPALLHESDYSIGLANRIGRRYAQKVLVTFEDTLKDAGDKGVYTGTPLRPDLFAGDRMRGLELLGFSGKKPVLLCMGGSQGAQAINEALRAALSELLKLFDVVHLCGDGKRDAACDGLPGYVQLEYIGAELPDILACAALAVSRAGANSAFELQALGIPSLLIPLPGGRGDQLQNARYLAERGRAVAMRQQDVTPQTLTDALQDLLSRRNTYAQAMREAYKDGTAAVLEQIFTVMES